MTVGSIAYRYWHYCKGETNYLMFHTLAPEMAVDDLVEKHEQSRNKSKSR